jgi:energy-coupling factor transport system ATP-binding protein
MTYAIEVENLWFKYVGSEDWILKDVSFKIREGETAVIMGPSGCGKSTLLYVLAGMAPRVIKGEMKGCAKIFGRDVNEMSLSEIARNVAFVFQNPEIQVLMPTVIEELIFGLENLGLSRGEIATRVDEILEFTGFKRREYEQPQSMSPGEKQLLAIASVLAMRPRILVLDEPTSMLDHPGTRRVLNLIEKIKRETRMTLLVVEHRIEWIAEHADRVLVMSDGKVVGEGTPKEVFSNKELVLKTGIRPPQVSEIFYYINEAISPMRSEIPITLDEALRELDKVPIEKPVTVYAETPSTKGLEGAGEVVIEARDIWFRYTKDQPWVLQGVDINVRRGEILALIGHSGVGKTTLVKHFNGLLKPWRGYVKVAGYDTKITPTSKLSRIVGLVYQNPEAQFFTSTIWEEMTIALRKAGLKKSEIEERVKWALRVVDLEKPLNMSPHLLSFGEKHRLAIATVLAFKPAVLVLDEPFSGLDYKRSLQILLSLRKYVEEGGSVVLVAHDLQLISEVADRIAVLEKGRVVRVGKTEELLSDIDWLVEHGFNPLQSALLARKIGLRGVVRTRDIADSISKSIKS